MAAAKKVFVDKGFHATTIADIAKEAGLAYSSVYWYFNSKDELFHALTAPEESALFFEADKATAKLLCRDAYAMDNRFDEHLAGIWGRFVDDIEASIVAAQEYGELVAVPPRMVAYTLAVPIGHLAHWRLTTDDGISAAEAADFVVTLVLNGLRPGENSIDRPPRRNATRPPAS